MPWPTVEDAYPAAVIRVIDGSWGGVIEAGSVGFVEVEHGQVGALGGRGDQ
jgi:hypothetical protein